MEAEKGRRMRKVFKIQRVIPGARIPTKSHPNDSGWDLSTPVDVTIAPGMIDVIDTGLRLGLEPGWEAQIRGRSGLGSKGIIIPNSPGTIDADYRGTIKLPLLNLGKVPAKFKAGDRVAQMIIAEIPFVVLALTDEDISIQTARGESGMGSSGVAEVNG